MTSSIAQSSTATLNNPPSGIFRTIHYLGSKTRLLDEIESLTSQLVLPGEAVCDMFSGSGAVASRFACEYQTTAVDIQEYSRVIASALLSPEDISVEFTELAIDAAAELATPTDLTDTFLKLEKDAIDRARRGEPDLLAEIVEGGSIVASVSAADESSTLIAEAIRRYKASLDLSAALSYPANRIFNYYGGVFFSYAQAIQIDALGAVIRRAPAAFQDTLTAALLGVASDISGTVGNHFAQPMRPRTKSGDVKVSAVEAVAKARSQDVFELFRMRVSEYRAIEARPFENSAVRADFATFLKSLKEDQFQLIYADPPYTRDHYSRFYHVLETICDPNDPGLTLVSSRGQTQPSRGLYRSERHQSPFCIKSQVSHAFETLIGEARRIGAHLILSYSPFERENHPRLLPIGTIEAMARSHYRQVEVVSAGSFVHSKFNASRLHKETFQEAEAFVVCEA